jgi:PHD/YefM family antitoxin component YafN of YafNO toxin-antitoxin module
MIVSGPIPFDYSKAMRQRKIARLSKLIPKKESKETVPSISHKQISTPEVSTPKSKELRVPTLEDSTTNAKNDSADLTGVKAVNTVYRYTTNEMLPFRSTIGEVSKEGRKMAMLIRFTGDVQKAALESPEGNLSQWSETAAIKQRLDLMRRINLGDFELMPNYSGPQELVFKNNSNGKIWVAARGTEKNYKMREGQLQGLGEQNVWPAIGMGIEEGTEPFISAERTVRRLIADGISPDDIVGGGSSMGSRMLRLGDEYGFKTILFGPYSGPNDTFRVMKNPSIQHELFSTTTDLPSLYIRSYPPKNVTVNTVDPINPFNAKTQTVTNAPMEIGELLFSSPVNTIMQHHIIAQISSKDELEMAIAFSRLRDNERVGEAFLIQSMKDSIEKGQTYTEWVHEFNSKKGVDTEVLEDGAIRLTGTRFRMNSAHAQIWRSLHEMHTTSDPFTEEEKSILKTSDPNVEVPLSNAEMKSIYDGELSPMDLVTSEQSSTLNNLVLNKSPETIKRFRLMSSGIGHGLSLASMVALQKLYENDGFSRKRAGEMSVANLALLQKAPEIYGRTVAATGIVRKATEFSKAFATASALEVPAAVGAFEVSDEAVNDTDKLMQKLRIDEQNRVRTDTVAGIASFDASVQGAKLGIGKMGTRFGYKFFERAAEKGGLKLLSSTLKASELGYALGTVLDVSLEASSLIQQWKEHKDVSSDRIGNSMRNIVDPTQMGDEAIDTLVPDKFKKPVKVGPLTIKNPVKQVYDWFSWTVFRPVRSVGEASKIVTSGIAHGLGAKTDAEKQAEFNRIANKSVMAVKDTDLDWKRYTSVDQITRKALTADEFNWMKNNYGLSFFNKLEKSHHEIWFKASRIMTNRQRAFEQMKNDVFIDDNLMNKIKGSDKDFYKTLQDYTNSHIELKKQTQLKGKSYVNFVNSKQDLATFVNESAQKANYSSADDYYYDVVNKTNVKKQEEQRAIEKTKALIPERGALRDPTIPDRSRLRQQFGP